MAQRAEGAPLPPHLPQAYSAAETLAAAE